MCGSAEQNPDSPSSISYLPITFSNAWIRNHFTLCNFTLSFWVICHYWNKYPASFTHICRVVVIYLHTGPPASPPHLPPASPSISRSSTGEAETSRLNKTSEAAGRRFPGASCQPAEVMIKLSVGFYFFYLASLLLPASPWTPCINSSGRQPDDVKVIGNPCGRGGDDFTAGQPWCRAALWACCTAAVAQTLAIRKHDWLLDCWAESQAWIRLGCFQGWRNLLP